MKSMLYVAACWALTLLCADSALAQQPALAEGDIVFQALPCGGLCDAIIATTPCEAGKRFNHCGIVRRSDGKLTVIEAIGERVQETPLAAFMARDTATELSVGRVRSTAASGAAAAAVQRARGYIGRPYDEAFLPGDSALYCSELIWESFRDSGDTALFPLRPMTFRPAADSAAHPAWRSYYERLGRVIPEGLPGINPCALAASPLVVMRRLPKASLRD